MVRHWAHAGSCYETACWSGRLLEFEDGGVTSTWQHQADTGIDVPNDGERGAGGQRFLRHR